MTIMKFSIKILFLFYLMIQSSGFTQIKIHKKLGVEEGLVQSTVRVIFKDNTDRLWFGTNLGVSCWDGINFTNYSTTSGLPGHIVYAVNEDKNGNVLFGTSNGAAIFKDGKISELPSIETSKYLKVKHIEAANNGNVFFGTDKGIFTLRGNKLVQADIPSMENSFNVLCGIKTDDGDIFWGTSDNGIIKMEGGNPKRCSVIQAIQNKRIENIFLNNEKNFVCNISGNLLLVSVDGKVLRELDLHKEYGNINSIEQDADGIYYFGTDNGIVVWKNKVIEEINEKNGLGSDKILSILKGDDGTFYFGMNSGGVAVINRYKMITLNKGLGLVDNNVTSIVEAGNNGFYFGTREKGISFFNRGTFKRIFNEYDQITCAFKDLYGKIYFGTSNGVLIINGDKKKSITNKDGLVSNIITAIAGSHDGKIYIGTVRGLSIYDNGKIQNVTKQNLLGDNLITSLFVKDNEVYVGTFFNGVTVIENGKSKIINKANGLISNTVLSVYKGLNGNLYIGTVEGLNVEHEGKIRTLNISSGLSDNSINSIIEDDNGRIYLATNRGVNILDESGGQLSISILHAEDGISGEECNMGAVYKDSDGNLWFGTIKGVVSFDPGNIRPSVVPPKVMLSSMFLYDKEIPLKNSTGMYEFSYDQNFFKFNFFGVMLSAPKRVMYAYRLKGIDEGWLTTNQNSVQYTNLNDGSYTFEVKAKNEWGYWSQPATISFVISPPFWERWWFILLSLSIFTGAVSLIISRQVRSVLALERLRLKIAADLHDNIGASLTEISMMSEIVKNKINSDSDETKKYLNIISNECRNVIASMRDIVWMVNPNQDSLKDLMLRLNDSFSDIFNQKGISFKTENVELLRDITLPMDYRHNLYLILKEGINNSLKYSYCDELFLKANVNGKKLEVILKDNGIGIKPSYRKHGNGLSNMRDRAKKIGGDLLINSDIYKGTELRFMGKIS